MIFKIVVPLAAIVGIQSLNGRRLAIESQVRLYKTNTSATREARLQKLHNSNFNTEPLKGLSGIFDTMYAMFDGLKQHNQLLKIPQN